MVNLIHHTNEKKILKYLVFRTKTQTADVFYIFILLVLAKPQEFFVILQIFFLFPKLQNENQPFLLVPHAAATSY